jgi:cell division protease FtsH
MDTPPTPTQPTLPPQSPRGRNLTPIFIIGAILSLVVLTTLWDPSVLGDTKKPGEFTDLISQIKQGKVSKITVSEDKKLFKTEVYKTDKKDRAKEFVEEKTYKNISPDTTSPIRNITDALPTDDDKKVLKFGSSDGEIIYQETPKSFWTQLFENPIFSLFLQIAIIAAIGMFLLRRLSEVNTKSMAFGNSRAKSYEDLVGNKVVTFADVAGNEEAKQELTEVVDFLKRPAEYAKLGAKIPRGALLVGSPGNGKTLMARAVAGEAKVPFLFVSGSEFVEMFVGVGAGRVRDLFKQAKRRAPCVIFIDEIDAVGRKRGSGMGNGNDEREQTLNQILVEMDGFETSESVIVLAATNRIDVLDKALLRPGRFDRQVTVTSPDKKEREKILEVHAKGKKLAKDIDLGIVARRTAGFSGADLANLLNEAAILAVREGKKVIGNAQVREAIEKVMLGPSLRSKVVTEDQKRLTAYHEAGHALIATLIPEADQVQKITIIPRGRAGGYTFTDRGENDPMTIKRSTFAAELSVLYGGYVVEQLYFGEVSTGPSNDLERATDLARAMVTKYGMSDLGPINFSESRFTADGQQYESSQMFSQDSSKAIDEQIKKVLAQAYSRTEQLITSNKKTLDTIAQALIERETLEYEEYQELVKDIMPITQKTSIAA